MPVATMTDNDHVMITLNDNQALPTEFERIHERSSRTRRRSVPRSRSTSRNRTGRDIEAAEKDAIPLIPENTLPHHNSPSDKDKENDDEDNSDDNTSPTHGIDDGFFVDAESELDGPKNVRPGNGHDPRRDSKPVFPSTFPIAPGYGPSVVIGGDNPRIIPDINVYQHKKSLAQGFMDLALLSANANQLRYVLESKARHPYYYFSLSFIITSLIIQVIVGIGLVCNSRYNIKNQDDICKADRINNLITIGILLITIINVFVSAFGVAEVH